jgi:hypothetical protein
MEIILAAFFMHQFRLFSPCPCSLTVLLVEGLLKKRMARDQETRLVVSG